MNQIVSSLKSSRIFLVLLCTTLGGQILESKAGMRICTEVFTTEFDLLDTLEEDLGIILNAPYSEQTVTDPKNIPDIVSAYMSWTRIQPGQNSKHQVTYTRRFKNGRSLHPEIHLPYLALEHALVLNTNLNWIVRRKVLHALLFRDVLRLHFAERNISKEDFRDILTEAVRWQRYPSIYHNPESLMTFRNILYRTSLTEIDKKQVDFLLKEVRDILFSSERGSNLKDGEP